MQRTPPMGPSQLANFTDKLALDRAFRYNSFGISTTIAFAFCYTKFTLVIISNYKPFLSFPRYDF
ncbi:hypothetical protein BUQ74_19250 [Leptospira weilii serovar Heyan]|nr:hypothetical protein BUQ74_19250 [Leptospira weilii serovar Heyan]